MSSIRRLIVVCGSAKYSEHVEALCTLLCARGHLVWGFATHNKSLYKQLEEVQRELIKSSTFRKIDLADEVHIVNTNGYIGDTTQCHLAYAIAKGKAIFFTDQQLAEAYMETYAHEIGKLASSYMMSA